MIQELFTPKIPHDRYIAEQEMQRKVWLAPYPIQVCYNLENKEPIPLKDVKYTIKVMNGLTAVEIEQIYTTTENSKPIELEYLFTINSNAAVISMIVELGDVIVHGVVKEKEEAKNEYKQGIKDGKTMAYCEQDELFPEIKRIKLGSLSPNKTLKIKFEYIQPLEVFLNKFWKLEVPPMIDSSYTNMNQENYYHNRLNQFIRQHVIIHGLHSFKQDFQVLIDVGSPITYLKSPTHLIRSNPESVKENSFPKKVEVVLQNEIQNFAANKPFTLLFSTVSINDANAILSHTNNDALQMEKYCATLTFIPKFNEVPLDDAYQQYVNGLNTHELQEQGNYLFFIDRSGSMAGTRIEQAKQALILFLKSLPENCNFNIVSFGTRHKLMWKQSKTYNQQNLTDAIEQVEEMTADMIGTEIYKPLNEIVYKNKTMVNVFLLTDGEVDAKSLIKLVKKNNDPSIRIYPVGLGGECSKYLIKRLAQITNGKYQFVDNNDNLNEKIIYLLEDAMSQTLQNFTLETDIQNVQKIIPDPQSILSLKNNQELTFHVLFTSENPQHYIRIGSFDPQNKKQIEYKVNIVLHNSEQNEYFHKLAAHKIISYYEQSVKDGEDYISGIKLNKQQIEDTDIVNISLQNQILCRQTAFICEVCNLEDQFKPQNSEKIIVNTVRDFKEHHNYFPQPLRINACSLSFQNQTLAVRERIGAVKERIGAVRGRGGAVKKCKQRCVNSVQDYEAQFLDYSDEDDRSRLRSRSRSRSLEREKCMKPIKKQNKQKISNIELKEGQEIKFDEIVKCFNADGSFNIPKNLNLLFGKINNSDKIQELLWHTILALLYLEMKYAEKRKEWQLLYRKSISYLKKNGINYEEKKKEYESLYQQILFK